MKRVINNALQPIVLESGTVMGASGTPGSIREGVELSEKDSKRYVRPDMLVVMETTVTTDEPPENHAASPLAPESKTKKENK